MPLIGGLFYRLLPFGKRYGRTFSDLNKELSKEDYDPLIAGGRNFFDLLHVAKYVPYYAKHGTGEIITKKIVKDYRHEFLAPGYENVRQTILKTSGSSGEPLQLLADKSIYEKEAAYIERCYRDCGQTLYFGKSIWLRRYVPRGPEDPLWYEHKEQRRLYMSAFNLSLVNLNAYLDVMDAYKSPLLVTYPSAAYIFATLCEEMGRIPKHLKHIQCSSEVLLPHWKKEVERILKIPIRDHYGHMEKAVLFHRCTIGEGYHEDIDYGEVTYDENNQIIATGYLNLVMPLIRYATGDIAKRYDTPKKCPCGSLLPLTVESIEGRSDDILQTKGGILLPPVNFYTQMYKIPGVKMWKIEQERKTKDVTVKVVLEPTTRFDAVTRCVLRDMRKKGLGLVDVREVYDIPRNTETGKIKVVEVVG